MKCQQCPSKATIRISPYNVALCPGCFVIYSALCESWQAFLTARCSFTPTLSESRPVQSEGISATDNAVALRLLGEVFDAQV